MPSDSKLSASPEESYYYNPPSRPANLLPSSQTLLQKTSITILGPESPPRSDGEGEHSLTTTEKRQWTFPHSHREAADVSVAYDTNREKITPTLT